MSELVPLVFPKHGLNDGFAYSEQPGLTTPSSKNMRTQVGSNGRLEGGQRSGYKKYNSAELIKNYASYTEDPTKGNRGPTLQNAPPSDVLGAEGWRQSVIDSLVFTRDGTLAPNGYDEAVFVAAVAGVQTTFGQSFDTKASDENPAADTHPGATFVRTSPNEVVASLWLKWKDGSSSPTQSTLILRQSGDNAGSDGLPIINQNINWSAAGVPTLPAATVSQGGAAVGFEADANGWYRFYVKITWATASESTSSVLTFLLRPRVGTTGELGLYTWGLQVELGATPSRYEPVSGTNNLEGKRKGAALLPMTYTQRWLSFTERMEPARLLSRKTPAKRDARHAKLDRQRNLYVLDGASTVLKLTPELDEVFSISVPLADPDHVCRSLEVDIIDCIYVAVTSGGEQSTASIFKYRQGPDVVDGQVTEDSYNLHWTIEAGRYVTDMEVFEGSLYTLQMDDKNGYAELVVYGAIDSREPEERLRAQVPYPSNGLTVKDDGSVVVCAPPNATRGLNPMSSGITEVVAGGTTWQPTDYASWDDKGWCWLDSQRINGLGTKTVDDFDHDDEVTAWIDLTGHERNVYTNAGRENPHVDLQAVGGLPGIYFNGVDEALISLPNPGTATTEDTKSQQRTLWPTYTNAEYTMVMVIQPARETAIGMVMGQQNISGGEVRAILSNRQESNSIPGTAVAGECCHFDHANTADPPLGTDSHPQQGTYGGTAGITDAVVIAIRVGPNTDDSDFTIMDSLISENYQSKATDGDAATGLGVLEEETGFPFYKGHILEIIVLDELVDDTTYELLQSYAAWKWGLGARLSGTYARGAVPAGAKAPIVSGKANFNHLFDQSTIAAKFSPAGDLLWTLVEYSGVGYDIIVNSDGDLYSLGPATEVTPRTPPLPLATGNKNYGFLRKILDGTAGSSAATSGEAVDPDSVVDNQHHNLIYQNGVGTVDVSSDFTHAFWSTSGTGVVTADVTNGPDGTATADRLDDNDGAAVFSVIHDFLFTGSPADIISGEDYTASVYVKEDVVGALCRIKLFHFGAASLQDTALEWDFSTGAIGETLVNGAGTHLFHVQEVNDGWIRIGVTVTADGTLSGVTAFRLELQPSRPTASQDSTFFWGAQLERGRKMTTVKRGTGVGYHFPSFEIQPYDDLYPRMDVDEFDNVYVPAVQVDASGAENEGRLFSYRIYNSNLELLYNEQIGLKADDDFQGVYAIAANPEAPDYREVSPGIIRNLALFTEAFDNAYWTKSNVNVTADNMVSPEGLLAADLLDDSSGGAIGSVSRLFQGQLIDGEDYTFSVHLRPNDSGESTILVEHPSGSIDTTLAIDWTASPPTGTLSSSGAGTHTFKLEKLANFFYRASVSITYDSSNGTGGLNVQIQPDSSAAAGLASVWAWGAQMEHGSVRTAYQEVIGDTAFAPAPGDPDADQTDQIFAVSPATDIEVTSGVNLDTIRKDELVREAPNGLPPRTQKLITAVRGSLVAVDRVSEPQVLRGGGSALDEDARYVSMTVLLQKLFATDGRRAVYWDPISDGRVQPMKATRGEFPERVQLLTNWRSRLFGARTPEDPHAWFASAIGDPFDWDYFTPPLTSDKAVFDGVGRAGQAPDTINSLISYDEVTLLIGCDHAIYYMDRDPLEGGRWVLLSDITGMSFGQGAWTKDPQGILYFFGARGGFYVFRPGQKPVRMTENTIERRLSDLDLDQYYVELRWNWRAEGIHIFVIPFGSGGTVVQHFFWGRRVDEWREDEFLVPGVQPTASAILDGDAAADRKLVFVDENRHVLEWDEDEKNDDGNAISSLELMGPFRAPDIDRELRWHQMTIELNESLDGCSFSYFAADNPQLPGSAKVTGTLVPGLNSKKLGRVKGSNLWVELSNSNVGESFAYERGLAKMAAAGRRRMR